MYYISIIVFKKSVIASGIELIWLKMFLSYNVFHLFSPLLSYLKTVMYVARKQKNLTLDLLAVVSQKA